MAISGSGCCIAAWKGWYFLLHPESQTPRTPPMRRDEFIAWYNHNTNLKLAGFPDIRLRLARLDQYGDQDGTSSSANRRASFFMSPNALDAFVNRQGDDEMASKKDCWTLILAILPHIERLLLHGPPGTGKTTIGQILAEQLGSLLLVVTMTEDTPMSELRGHYIMRGGDMVWHDGPISRWWKTPNSVLVINEINMAGGDVLGYLHGALDDPARAYMTLPTGETIRPSGGQKVIATMNGQPEEMIPAIRDRFPVCINVDRVNPDAVKLLAPELRDIAANSTVVPDENRRVSIRAFFEFDRLRKLVPEDTAARAIFGARHQELLDAIKVASAGGSKSAR